jgi:hypothetical protein
LQKAGNLFRGLQITQKKLEQCWTASSYDNNTKEHRYMIKDLQTRTWNTRGLSYKIDVQILELTTRKTDIGILSETKKSSQDLGEYVIYSSVPD